MTYKIMNKLCPEHFFHEFLQRSSVLKQYTALSISPGTALSDCICKKGFTTQLLMAWNDISAELRELPTINSFKKQFKTYLKG